MIKHIKFTIGGVFSGYKTVELAIGTKNVSYKILRNGLNDIDKKNSRVVGLSEEWLADFDALNISSWETDYTNAEVQDGTQWELIYKWGKKSYIGHGSNAYPENWNKFLDWLDKLIPQMQFVNRKQLEKVTLNYYRVSAIGYEIFEDLTLDRREKTLTLNKKNAQTNAKHIYDITPVEDKIFDAAQDFFDNLEMEPSPELKVPKIKIELVRHSGSVDNLETVYSEGYLPGLTKFIEVIKGFVSDLSAEIFAPINDGQDKDDKYIFCKVQFKGSYKSYTYRTEDETLAVGDVVDVPVGRNNDVAQARIVEIGYFDEEEALFPIDRIKMIIGKHVVGDWENY